MGLSDLERKRELHSERREENEVTKEAKCGQSTWLLTILSNDTMRLPSTKEEKTTVSLTVEKYNDTKQVNSLSKQGLKSLLML
jgi:hypothetical protein